MKNLIFTIALVFISFMAQAKYGDVNQDGYVTSADITALYDYLLLGDATFLSTSDVNQDGYVTSADITTIYDIILNGDSNVDANGLFHRCYATMATSGASGGDWNVDISGFDGGYQSFYRQLWNSNELPTDEAICGWGDDGIRPLSFNYYTEQNPMLKGYFLRLYYSIFLCNTYLNYCSDNDAQKTAEVRFLRAMYYYFAMDAFGNIPYYTEWANNNNSSYVTTGDGKYSYPQWTTIPTFSNQKSRSEMFTFIENELKTAENDMAEPTPKNSSHEMYWRADKAAAWLLLSRLYLNSQVYTGTAQWSKARDYAKKVINSSYQLFTSGYNGTGIDGVYREYNAYQMLFMGDNGETEASREALLIIPHNGDNTNYTTWSTSTFLIGSTYDSDMHPNPYSPEDVNGLYNNNTWSGNRMRPSLVSKFFGDNPPPLGHAYDVAAAANDDRAIFETESRKLNVKKVSDFKNGYATAKFNNFKTDGSQGSDVTFPDMDVFLLRKAEAYLTYAEALTRLAGGGAAPAEAVNAINTIRARSHASLKSSYSLNDILDEWSREFYFEGRRRVDLIRFGKYGGSTDYLWQWKSGYYNGRDFSALRNVFAIPQLVIDGSPTISQNEGYNPQVIDNAISISVTTDEQNTTFTCNDLSAVLSNIPDPEGELVISTDPTFLNPTMMKSCSIDAIDGTLSAQVNNSVMNELIINSYYYDGSGQITLYAKIVCNGKSSGSNDYMEISSNIVQWNFQVIVPQHEPDPVLWYMVGNCIGNCTWSNGSASDIGKSLIPLLPEPEAEIDAYGNTTLVYAGYFPAGGQFKFIKDPGGWDFQMNFTNLVNPDYNIVSDEDWDNHIIGILNSGYYKITMNTITYSFTIEKLDITPSIFTTITMPGDYQDWNAASNAMTAMEGIEPHDWYTDAYFGSDANLKFAVGSWDTNWGGNDFPMGYGVQYGDNILVPAGNYRVYFNDILGLYYFMTINE